MSRPHVEVALPPQAVQGFGLGSGDHLMNKVQANYWRAAGVVEEPARLEFLRRIARKMLGLRKASDLPAEVFPVLRELKSLVHVSDRDPITQTPEFDQALALGLISSGGGMWSGYNLTPRGEKALTAHAQRYPS